MIQQQVKGYSKEEERKSSEIDNVMNALNDIEELSFKVLCEMKEKEELYFGVPVETPAGVSGFGRDDNGLVNKMMIKLDNIKGNFLKISRMLNSF